MSFVGKKSTKDEIKLKEKGDENLKITINDKIFEIMTKNSTLKEKLEKISTRRYIIREDEEFIEKILNDVNQCLENSKKLVKEFEDLINRKYSSDINTKDKLFLAKGQMCKTIDKEIDNYNKNVSKFQAIKTNLTKKSEADYNESNNLLSDTNEEEENLKYKVSDKQIKHYEHISKHRKEQIENIYSNVLMVQKITDDINLLTHQQDKKIEQIDDNIEPVLINSKDTFKKLIKASNEDKKLRNNNCLLMIVIILSVFFLILVLINYKN